MFFGIVGNHKKSKVVTGNDSDIFITKKQIYEGLDKYSCQVKDIDHILVSAYQEDDTYSYKELIRKLKPVNKLVNFLELREEFQKISSKEDDEDVEYM